MWSMFGWMLDCQKKPRSVVSQLDQLISTVASTIRKVVRTNSNVNVSKVGKIQRDQKENKPEQVLQIIGRACRSGFYEN
jgi:hypothetical protein